MLYFTFYYTDADSAKAIQESGMIQPDNRGRVFVTTDESCATHRVEIKLNDPNDGNLTTIGAT